MKEITNEIFDIKNHSIYIDSLKADYMLELEILQNYIFDSEIHAESDYNERIEEKIKYLILHKEELVTELIRFINNMNELDHELHIWRKKNENKTELS